MKPIHLKLAGLNSYREEQEIDFEELCAAGLFGIFGPTGSGKSTILDAITYALYGQVVRIGGSSHPQEVMNQLENRLFVSFTFELGRDGERKRYTIERESTLDKKGKRRPAEVRLILRGQNGEPDQVLESKATSATEMIESLLGLTLHDFTRAVVLPQGQFSRFLTLKGSDRNEMLQRIFHLHEYGERLMERAKAMDQALREEWMELERELAVLGDASEEAVATRQQELAEKTEAEQEVASGRERLLAVQREWQQIRQWQEELQRVRGRLTELSLRAEEFHLLEQRIGQIERAVQLWPIKTRREQTERELQEAGYQLLRMREEQVRLRQHVTELETLYTDRVKAREEKEPVYIEQKALFGQALQWEQERDRLQAEREVLSREKQQLAEEQQIHSSRVLELEQQLAKLVQTMQEIDQTLQIRHVSAEERKHLQALFDAKQAWLRERNQHERSVSEAANAAKERQQAEEALLIVQNRWQAAREEAEAAKRRLTEWQQQEGPSEEEWKQQQDILFEVKTLGREWHLLEKQEAEWRTKQEQHQEQVRTAEEQLLAAENEWQTWERERLEKERSKVEAETRLAEWQKENAVRLLRLELLEGMPCPVCGSEHHQHAQDFLPTHDALATFEETEWRRQVEESARALQEAEGRTREAYGRLQQAKAQMQFLQSQQQVLEDEQGERKRKREEVQNRLRQLGEEWSVTDYDELVRLFRERQETLQDMQEKRSQWKAQAEKLNEEWQRAREAELALNTEYEKGVVLLSSLTDKLNQAIARRDEAAALAARAKETLDRLRGDMDESRIEEAYREMAERDEEMERLRSTRSRFDQERQRLAEEEKERKEKLAQLAMRLAAVSQSIETHTVVLHEIDAKWRACTGGRPAQECLAELEQAWEQLKHDCIRVEQELEAERKELSRLEQTVFKLEEAIRHLSRQRQEAELEWEKAAAETGITWENIEVLFQSRDSLPELKRQTEEYRTEQTQLLYDEQRLSGCLAGRNVPDEEWLKLEQALQEQEAALQAIRDQVAVLKEACATLERNHERWKELQARREALAAEQSRLDELRKLFEGKAFVQFIAEEKLASIARDASYHLARMTKNRYALEIGERGEFVLRDEGAGGLRRPVDTLSGGETFLTSLALALALSVEIQMRGSRLEFFFLDEGFGTLDPELLEVVMDALERLRMNNFAIGVISHVPELRQRMPRRLIVTPAEPLGRGSRVTLEAE